jgi:hypothetical protein
VGGVLSRTLAVDLLASSRGCCAIPLCPPLCRLGCPASFHRSQTPTTTPSHSSLLKRLQQLRAELPAVEAAFMETSRVSAAASASHYATECAICEEYKRCACPRVAVCE